MQDYTFDLQRIFFGDLPPLIVVEIALRSVIMLLYLLLLMRLLGQRGIAQFSLLEFIIIIALGSAVGDPMFYPEIPLLHGMAVITVVVLTVRMLIWVTNRSHKIEDLLEGKVHCLVQNGRFHIDGLQKNAISRNEIYMQLRLAGVEQLGQVKVAYLELNGKMSIFLLEEHLIQPGLPMMPEMEFGEVTPLDANDAVTKAGDYACLHCAEVIQLQTGQVFPMCPRCQDTQWVQANATRIKPQLKQR